MNIEVQETKIQGLYDCHISYDNQEAKTHAIFMSGSILRLYLASKLEDWLEKD